MSSENQFEDPSGIGDRPQDAFVAERLSSPTELPARTLILSGLLGDSDRPGFRRLYFNKQLDYYAEFASADVVSVTTVPKDQPPFVGLESTKVELRRDATINFTQVRAAVPMDEFDLDLRLSASRRAFVDPMAQTWEAECPGPTWGCQTEFACGTDNECPSGWTVCKPRTCACTDATCQTDCRGATCADTCQTCPGQATCGTCPGQHTCQTCPGQQTCATCQTCPDQQTCVTCETCARQNTCNPHVFTCGTQPQCA